MLLVWSQFPGISQKVALEWGHCMYHKTLTNHFSPLFHAGFMLVEALNKIFQNSSKCVNCDIVTEFLTLMQRFEVILMLDKQRILIPSLLPKKQQDSCIVFPKFVSLDELEMTCCLQELSKQPYAPICQLPHPILVRFYLLPFVPNGFFPRLIARLMGGNIMEHLLKSLTTGPLDSHHILNLIHWQCWQNGIILIWNHFEIFRIAPLTYPLPGTTSARVISNSGESKVETLKGIEVKVAVLPETCIKACSVLPNMDNVPNKGKCLATWLLHQVSDLVDSVFDDWYEAFARKKGYDLSVTSTVNPCTMCFKNVIAAEVAATVSSSPKHFAFSTSFADCCLQACRQYGLVHVLESILCLGTSRGTQAGVPHSRQADCHRSGSRLGKYFIFHRGHWPVCAGVYSILV